MASQTDIIQPFSQIGTWYLYDIREGPVRVDKDITASLAIPYVDRLKDKTRPTLSANLAGTTAR